MKWILYINTQFVLGEDILFAMSTLGFDNYVEPLKLYLQKYREAMKVCFTGLLLKEQILADCVKQILMELYLVNFSRVRDRWRQSFPTLEEKLWLDSSFRCTHFLHSLPVFFLIRILHLN